MKTKLLIVLILMVCLPLGLLAWLGMRLAKEQRNMARAQVRDILLDQLRETDQTIGRYFEEIERDLLRTTEVSDFDTNQLREVLRTEPLVNQLFVLAPDGQLIHPNLGEPLNSQEQEFLQRAKPFLVDRDLVRVAAGEADLQPTSNAVGKAAAAPAVANQSPANQAAQVPSPPVPPARHAYSVKGKMAAEPAAGEGPSHGWYLWYWGRGLNLIFWRKLPGDYIVGVELPRLRWMSDVLARLPDTALHQETGVHSRVQLTDSSDALVYQWGSYEPPATAIPLAERGLSEPLASWRLKYYVAEEGFAAFSQRSVYFNLFTGLAVAAAGLLAMALWWYRESLRELREAATRVNFVNQVSHELKTPLTNIRMYAELLQRDLEASEDLHTPSAQRVKVIMAESSRLSRLIGNVLTFARAGRQALQLKPRVGVIDQLVSSVLESFDPTLKQRGIEVEFIAGAPHPVVFDVDAVEQILVNLISNVEKYATEGKLLRIVTRQNDSTSTLITIADRGPGIRGRERSRVFEPFYRVSDKLEGAAGAGIGLSIARSLAELHGGQLNLLPSEVGALFEVKLHTPRASAEELPS